MFHINIPQSILRLGVTYIVRLFASTINNTRFTLLLLEIYMFIVQYSC